MEVPSAVHGAPPPEPSMQEKSDESEQDDTK